MTNQQTTEAATAASTSAPTLVTDTATAEQRQALADALRSMADAVEAGLIAMDDYADISYQHSVRAEAVGGHRAAITEIEAIAARLGIEVNSREAATGDVHHVASTTWGAGEHQAEYRAVYIERLPDTADTQADEVTAEAEDTAGPDDEDRPPTCADEACSTAVEASVVYCSPRCAPEDAVTVGYFATHPELAMRDEVISRLAAEEGIAVVAGGVPHAIVSDADGRPGFVEVDDFDTKVLLPDLEHRATYQDYVGPLARAIRGDDAEDHDEPEQCGGAAEVAVRAVRADGRILTVYAHRSHLETVRCQLSAEGYLTVELNPGTVDLGGHLCGERVEVQA